MTECQMKREGALKDKEKSDVGEGRKSSTSLFFHWKQLDRHREMLLAVFGCDRYRLVMNNVLENFLQNSTACCVSVQEHMSWLSLFHCCSVTLLCFVLSVSGLFYLLHVTVCSDLQGCVCSLSLEPPLWCRVNIL